MTVRIALVRQEQRFGCQAAVGAMLLGLTYSQAAHLLATDPAAFDRQGISFIVLESQLVNAGYAVARKFRTMQPGNVVRDEWPCAPWADAHWCEVISHGFAHAVVLLGNGTVLDPAKNEPCLLADYDNVNFIAAVVPVNRAECENAHA